MNIKQEYIPAGRRNRPGRVNPMRFITVHNTGNANAGANAKAHAIYIKSDAAANEPVSWHYTVDDKEIYQHLPDNEDAFHAGDGAGNGNRQSIGIEICMNCDGDLRKATDNAAELTAMLCARYKIPAENIVQHNRWSGKNCPQTMRGGKPYGWSDFLAKVHSAIAPPAETAEMVAAAKNNLLYMTNNIIKDDKATLDSIELDILWFVKNKLRG